MRRFIVGNLLLIAGASSISIAFGQVDEAPKVQAPQVSSVAPVDPVEEAKAREAMNLLLDEWEKRTANVNTLHLVFERIDRSKKWGDHVYQGQAILKGPDLACLDFKKAIIGDDGKPKYQTDKNGRQTLEVEKEPFQRIVWTSTEVFHYEWDERTIYIYPPFKESPQKSFWQILFSFQFPRPFFVDPLLFHMKAADARQRFDMKLLKGEQDEYLIEMIPRRESERRYFHRALLQLDKDSFRPKKLCLCPLNPKEDRQDLRFSLISVNAPVEEAYFHPKTDVQGWRVNRSTGH